MVRLRAWILSLALGLALAGAAEAATMGDPDVAALQVALHSRALYDGTIDGWIGPGTSTAVRLLQRLHGLPVSGSAGPRTRAALAPYADAELGTRLLRRGMSGWDVAALQFLLAWHGFPSRTLDGVLGDHTEAALLAFQAWAGLPTTGQAGPLTLAALDEPLPRSPITLAWPLALPVGDGFGPRGARFHPGIDVPAARGTPVQAAAGGVVVSAGFAPDGYGKRVVLSHSDGVTTIYAHLLRVDAVVGQQVAQGDVVGVVGASGEATGPHLHFEVRVRGAAVDPLTALP